jgi:hypothetical protein
MGPLARVDHFVDQRVEAGAIALVEADREAVEVKFGRGHAAER